MSRTLKLCKSRGLVLQEQGHGCAHIQGTGTDSARPRSMSGSQQTVYICQSKNLLAAFAQLLLTAFQSGVSNLLLTLCLYHLLLHSCCIQLQLLCLRFLLLHNCISHKTQVQRLLCLARPQNDIFTSLSVLIGLQSTVNTIAC